MSERGAPPPSHRPHITPEQGVSGTARLSSDKAHEFHLVGESNIALRVEFDMPPPDHATFERTDLRIGEATLALGPSRFVPNGKARTGSLVFTDSVYDFSRIFPSGSVRNHDQDFGQVPLLFNSLSQIRPEFREYVSDLSYQLQVYRGIFDDIDAKLAQEPEAVQALVRENVVAKQGREFMRFFDDQLAKLGELVSGFSRKEHEQHGSFLRRQLWDTILRSDFLRRTNLRPRGYAGDSMMMQWVYENRFAGPTIFDQLMHKHPIESDAAQAVRNRREFVSGMLGGLVKARTEAGETTPTRFLSLACGPAWEMRDLFASERDTDLLECVLLDQDEDALDEAKQGLAAVERELGRSCKASFVQDSVRTMLRSQDLESRLGRFHCIYSMGLFDYLNRPVATAVLRKMYSLLEPGGELVIGNFHVGNKTRVYLDYWMDWSLLYRTEEEFLAMTTELDGATAEVIFEETRSQMFLRVRREST